MPIVAVDLRHNHITDTGAVLLAACIAADTKKRSSPQRMQQHKQQQLAWSEDMARIAFLDLRGNSVSTAGVRALAEAVRSSSYLSVAHVYVGRAGLVQALGSSNPKPSGGTSHAAENGGTAPEDLQVVAVVDVTENDGDHSGNAAGGSTSMLRREQGKRMAATTSSFATTSMARRSGAGATGTGGFPPGDGRGGGGGSLLPPAQRASSSKRGTRKRQGKAALASTAPGRKGQRSGSRSRGGGAGDEAVDEVARLLSVAVGDELDPGPRGVASLGSVPNSRGDSNIWEENGDEAETAAGPATTSSRRRRPRLTKSTSASLPAAHGARPRSSAKRRAGGGGGAGAGAGAQNPYGVIQTLHQDRQKEAARAAKVAQSAARRASNSNSNRAKTAHGRPSNGSRGGSRGKHPRDRVAHSHSNTLPTLSITP